MTSSSFAPFVIDVELAVMTDEVEQRVLDDIAEFGWHLIQVYSDDQGPALAYSIGMIKMLGHPEIIMFGLATNLMAKVINDAGFPMGTESSFL